jgi:alcohol dehydrogenase
LTTTAPDRWSYCNPVEVIAGAGQLRSLAQEASGQCLVVTTGGATRRGLTNRVRGILGSDRTIVFDRVDPNPAVDAVEAASRELRHERIDTLVAVGGGSSVDFAKAIGAVLRRPDVGLWDLLDGDAAAEEGDGPALIAVPTTAGSGSEVTPFATLWDRDRRAKRSLTSARLFARVALLDPELTTSLPWKTTLSGALDAYCQCLEAIWNRGATPVASALAQHGARLVFPALDRVRTDPQDLVARADLMTAATLSGLAISTTRTALAHAMSYPLTAHFGVPHGLACGWFVPAVLAFNGEVDDGRLRDAAAHLGHSDIAAWVRDMVATFRRLGIGEAVVAGLPGRRDVESVAPEMLGASRADNNMRRASVDDVRAIVSRTFDWLV